MRLSPGFILIGSLLALAACSEATPPEVAKEGEATEPVEVAKEGEAAGPAAVALAPAAGDENTLILELKSGKVIIKLRPDLAPKHVERVKQLTREGFYDGLKFHRVIDGFMAQTGDPLGTGEGGSKLPDLPAEFTPTPFERGTIGAARTADPNSANSQFFICFVPTPHLNRQYTVWGQVTEGMELVDQIAKGEPPPNPDIIVKMQLASDGK